MKSFILLLVSACIGTWSLAQSKRISTGGYGAASAELTWVNDKPALSVGAWGGVLLSHKVLLGGAGSNILFKETVNGTKENFQFNYYGLYAGYVLYPEKPLHYSLGITGAMGWLENNPGGLQKRRKKDGDYTYVIQPRAGLEFTLTRFMQIQAYGSYRFTGNTRSLFYTGKNFNGFSGGLSLLVGKF